MLQHIPCLTNAGVFASDLGKAFFAEANTQDLNELKAQLMRLDSLTALQITQCLTTSQVRRYIPDPCQLASGQPDTSAPAEPEGLACFQNKPEEGSRWFAQW